MAFKDAPQCTATAKRTGERCTLPAVTGSTKCRVHGGKTPKGANSVHFKHGRYSAHVSKAIQDKLALADDNPLDLLPELDVQRALFADYLSRFKDTGGKLAADDINMLMQWLTDIGRMVERIAKQRNEDALTGAELTFLAARIADVVCKYIHDPIQQQAFIADIFAEIPTADRITANADYE